MRQRRRALGASYPLSATSGWAPSLYPSTSFFTPLFLSSSEDSGRQENHLPSVIPHVAPQLSSPANDLSWPRRRRYEEKNTTKTREAAPRGEERKVKCILQVLFLSSDGHLDIYRDLVHNHFNICKCLLRLESRRWTERTRLGPSFSPCVLQVQLQRKHRGAPFGNEFFRHELSSHNTNITINDSISL